MVMPFRFAKFVLFDKEMNKSDGSFSAYIDRGAAKDC